MEESIILYTLINIKFHNHILNTRPDEHFNFVNIDNNENTVKLFYHNKDPQNSEKDQRHISMYICNFKSYVIK